MRGWTNHLVHIRLWNEGNKVGMTELGIALDPSAVEDGPTLIALARAAEQAGLDLVVVIAAGSATQGPGAATPTTDAIGLDAWTVATWLAAGTSRIALGLPLPTPEAGAPTDPTIPIPAVVNKARESLMTLAGQRLIHEGWVVSPAHADAQQVRDLAHDGARAVVVPVTSVAEIERLAA
ncbi:LLM class flavin-dependent oxidoreductase, partial [Pseudactinotalea sp.]|uniref:LLM class flavin-dependent oxidoreductase n=1 Tax=Pseudactinotalea sp. TaxID=1926260 RepID=UPI003B3B3016